MLPIYNKSLPYPSLEDLINAEKTNKKVMGYNIDFVNRLKDPNRKTIPDWEDKKGKRISTHKMSVGEDEEGNSYIYPEVQNINGKLIDFTRPPYRNFMGMIAAEERGDTIHLPFDDALNYSINYKKFHKGRLRDGGSLTYLQKGGILDRLKSVGKQILTETAKNRQAMRLGTTPDAVEKIKTDPEYREKAEKATIAGATLPAVFNPALYGYASAAASPYLKAVGVASTGALQGISTGMVPGMSTGSPVTDAAYGVLGEGVAPVVSKGLEVGGKALNKHVIRPVVQPVLKNVKSSYLGRYLGKEVDNLKLLIPEPENIGWGPKQEIAASHKSNSADELKLVNPKRWDVVNGGANPLGIWYQGKLGVPRTPQTTRTLEKAEKAAKARELFANRPYNHAGNLQLDKPITTIGDVADRHALSWRAEKMGADGIIYNNIYDNGYDANNVILSFKKHVPETTEVISNVGKKNSQSPVVFDIRYK